MTEASASDALTLLSYALDEMRETTSLLPVAAVSRSFHRPWWRNVFFGFVRSKAEVSAELSVQYLGENIDRARDHWRAALLALGDLQRAHPENEIVVLLGAELGAAGVGGVLPRLQHDAVPQPIAKTAAHLEAVVGTIRDCDRLVLDARNKLTVQRMRNAST
jgi:hypothetical protein